VCKGSCNRAGVQGGQVCKGSSDGAAVGEGKCARGHATVGVQGVMRLVGSARGHATGRVCKGSCDRASVQGVSVRGIL